MNKYAGEIKLIECRLDELTRYSSCSYEKLLEAQRYSIMAGGKHLRGLILVKTAQLGKNGAEYALDAACALEMVHTYSLIHDDLPEMDNDDMRRGKPTCHIAYGADMALLAGDALLTKAFSVIANIRGISERARLDCIEALAAACGEHGMLAGQAIDKLSENRSIDIELLRQLHSRKTADMFRAAVKMGCITGGVDDDTACKLDDVMLLLGLAFQIKDDLLDVTSDSDHLGKPVKSDLKSGKSTFVSLIGKEQSERLLREYSDRAKSISEQICAPFFTELCDYFINRTK